ncbi:DnaD domain-containing protein [Bacillus dakarensis]|uniref:DnaD domain-containing protein n=1 Tax=Robertmurraya dakarensis TaxID=1926278 RepID=UPI000981AD69|nr:DnaD domain-containing protein [Bacillus dakarensis]
MKDYLVQWLQEGNLTIPMALMNYYKQLNLNEEELVLILHVLSFQEKGNEFPTPNEISSKMTFTVTQCTELLRKLIQKGMIDIQEGYSDTGIRFEKYSIQPLWEKLIDVFLKGKNEVEKKQQQKDEMDLYTVFEQEFGRPLSPFECESLALWMDDDRHEPILIKAALREAVISGKLNFRYIDRILFEWKKNGVKTIEQAKNHGRKFRSYQTKQQPSQPKETESRSNAVPFYNWLEQ